MRELKIESFIDKKSFEGSMHEDSLRVMHIVINLDIGGAQENVRTLVKYLAKAGYEPVVCTFKDGPLRQEIEQLGIPVEILPERRYSIMALPLSILEIFRIRKELIQLIHKYQIDIIQTHLLQSLDFLAATLHFLTEPPSIYWTVQNYKFTLQKEDLPRFQWLLYPKRFVYRLLYSLCIPWIDGVIAVAEDVKEALVEGIGPVAEEKITVICNAVDLERYQKPLDKQLIRKTLGLGKDLRLALVVAMLKKQKGHYYLINAATRIIPEFPDLHFLFIGDGDLKEALQAQTTSLGVEKNIHFLGLREDIPDLLAGSDYFILPSLWEGLPLSLVEAMASGLPIVATDVSGSKEVMISGVTGWLVPPGNSQKLAIAIIEMLSHPERAVEMGAAAQQRVWEEYSANKQVKEHIRLYQRKYKVAGRVDIERDINENI